MAIHLDAYRIIKRPVITEKVTRLTELFNTYGFEVDRRANKIQIRQAIKDIWPDVTVTKITTRTRKGKPRRVRTGWDHSASIKLALVTLAEGQTIEG